jgi:hypothetical protein
MLYSEQVFYLNKQIQSLINFYRLNVESLSNSADQIKLYRMLESQELMDIEKKRALEKVEKNKKINFEIDTLQSIIKNIENKQLVADTIKPIGFQAICHFQIRFKDKSVKQDTTYILLNLNRDIIKHKDFINLPYNVDFENL